MKKTKILKTTALLLSAVMALQSGAAALGTVTYKSSIPIGMGTSLHNTVYTYSGVQNEHYIEYVPNNYVTPVVVYGSKVCNYGNFDTMAGLLEKKGWRVIGGTNGDYYVMANYQPVGMLVTEGVLQSSDGGVWAVGFRADGSGMIGKPATAASITLGSTEYRIYGINKQITKGDFYLYTDTYSYTTKNTVPTVNVVLSYPEDYELKLNSEAELVVEEIVPADSELYMREGKFILSLTQDSDAWRMGGVDRLSVGDTVKLKVTADEDWNDIDYAVGALYKLIENGEILSGVGDDKTAPRTAVGMREDGSIIFFTVDGRQSGYSIGLTVPAVAERLLELGCVEACLLDGGASTNIHAQYIGDDNTSQINRPSNGSERSVTNYIMLVAKEEGSGELRQLAVYPNEPQVLLGSSVQFEVRGADEASMPVEPGNGTVWRANGGSMSTDGMYTPSAAGSYDVSAYHGGLSDTSTVTVIETPDKIALYRDGHGKAISELNLYTGMSELLTAEAYYNSLPVISSAEAYKWEVVGNIGSIDQSGVFTAGEQQGSGKIIVSAGDCSVEIDVTVGVEIKTIEDFESFESAEETKEYVRFGEKSLRLEYAPDESGRTFIPLGFKLDKRYRYITLWVNGDAGGEKLGLIFDDGSECEIASVDFSGWRQISVPVDASGGAAGFYVSSARSGTIWLDQICASTTSETDEVPPDIAISAEEGTVIAAVADNIDAVVAKNNISLRYDGKLLDFEYDASSGTVKAYIELQQGIHRVSVTARDQSGNVASKSISVALDAAEMPFEDSMGHWAEEYIAYMYSQQVVDGVAESAFAPDANVTRAQCALMICRWLGIDTALYSDVELDFVDNADIPDYALDAVRAVYAQGIITGLDTVEGVYYAPNKSLTREQAMTIIGRVQQSGYARAELGAYSDAEKVQSWSAKYVQELMGRGIISGFEDGTLRPGAAVTRAQLVKILTEVR